MLLKQQHKNLIIKFVRMCSKCLTRRKELINSSLILLLSSSTAARCSCCLFFASSLNLAFTFFLPPFFFPFDPSPFAPFPFLPPPDFHLSDFLGGILSLQRKLNLLQTTAELNAPQSRSRGTEQEHGHRFDKVCSLPGLLSTNLNGMQSCQTGL